MSVLIKGIKMPSCCETCPCNDDNWRCGALGDTFDGLGIDDLENRPSFCPLVEVPEPHGRLIDGDALERFIIEKYSEGEQLAIDISDAPTVIEAEGDEHE